MQAYPFVLNSNRLNYNQCQVSNSDTAEYDTVCIFGFDFVHEPRISYTKGTRLDTQSVSIQASRMTKKSRDIGVCKGL